MTDHIVKTIKKFNMISKGDKIAVALSGGADSVCLLLCLIEIKNIFDISLCALHVNHCLRGKDSDDDENFCIQLCKKLDIPIISKKFDVAGYAKEKKLSTEQAARDIRYAFFKENTFDKKLATAHNANDNAETVLFNLTRGTGIKGISGIPPVRDNIIRPLIEITREEIEQYLSKAQQNFVTDKTNLTDDYTRNKIRHNVIPVLTSINSSFLKTITSDSENFRTDDEFINSYANDVYNKCKISQNRLEGLNNYHTALKRRCIAKFLDDNNIDISHKRISEIESLCTTGGKINIRKDTYLVSDRNTITIEYILQQNKNNELSFPMKDGLNKFFKKNVFIKTKSIEKKNSDTIVIDADKIIGTAVIRNRRCGDKIKIFGNDFTSSVKKLFNSKIPREERDDICFIADDHGPVFIEKIGIAQRVAVTEHTKNIIEISIDCV